MSADNTAVTVYDSKKNKPIAHIILNGRNLEAGGPLGYSGAMRSFKIVQGDLWEFWNLHVVLTIRDEAGREARIRVAALPLEKENLGFVEFV